MIDKGLYKKGRVGLKGGADASQFNVANPKKVNVSAGSATLGDTPLTTLRPTVRDNRKGDDNVPFVPKKTVRKKPPSVRDFFGGILNSIPGFKFLRNLNNPATRTRLTGYPTQAAYEQARQNRINLKRIQTLENTIQRKYLDKNRSLDETDLDERLAGLKSLMGITENTEADLRPDLDFSNQAEGVPDFVPQNNVTQNGVLSTLSNLSGNIDTLSKFPNLNDLYNVDRNIFLNQEMAKSFTPDQINKMMNPPGQMDNTGINFYNDDVVPLDPNLNLFKVNDQLVNLTNELPDNTLMTKLATNSPALAQFRSLQKKQRLSELGGPEFTIEDQQKLDLLNQMEADPDNIYSQTI